MLVQQVNSTSFKQIVVQGEFSPKANLIKEKLIKSYRTPLGGNGPTVEQVLAKRKDDIILRQGMNDTVDRILQNDSRSVQDRVANFSTEEGVSLSQWNANYKKSQELLKKRGIASSKALIGILASIIPCFASYVAIVSKSYIAIPFVALTAGGIAISRRNLKNVKDITGTIQKMGDNFIK